MNQLKKMAFAERRTMLLLVLFACLSGVVIVFQAYYFVKIVDLVFLKNASFGVIEHPLWILLALLFARVLFMYAARRTGIRLASKVKGDIRRLLFVKYAKNPIQASLSGQTGRKVSTAMDAVDEIDSYFSSYIPQIIQTAIVPVLILLAVFTQPAFSGLLMLITAPFIPIFMAIIGIKTQKKAENQMEKMAAFSGHFLDTLQGLTTLKLFGRARQQRETIRKSSFDFRDATMEVLKIAFISSLTLEFISTLSIGLIAFELCLRLVVFKNISFFSAFFILILAPDFYLSLKDLGNAFHSGRGSKGAFQKVADELAQEERSILWGTVHLLKDSSPPALEIQDLTFTYDEGDFAIKNLNVTIPPYEKIAIVGPNGSGKTTLLHIIAGLLEPTAGVIRVNNKSRTEYEEESWFNQISYISQNPYLFSGTIAENICLGGDPQASMKDVELAAQKAGLSKMIQSLEHGIDTTIGEAGRGLSGGEKQRVALARAFLKQPSLILFDEPTTGLDLYTEQILQASMCELSKKSTVITVAHRLYTIQDADQILFLKNGRLVAAGRHDDLIERVTEYRNMVHVQQGGGVK
ncbi:thiol reductant ABC exporter subunit CydD [Peribacillus huizhouensis]|uniref:ATP-binding cassette subfamily C protein CydD n=1 Tax=Peribacillus huizhouensis TaxID=1501239 RepID=A0ABR6CNK5_9BACI|nr:thiol reductant ABC exporter subunit CydD [Peribacillus huizhouensis]MBA9026624.1 ATP-binding cassette subfamily C protein CydD [Peribacillus huizhouensis]